MKQGSYTRIHSFIRYIRTWLKHHHSKYVWLEVEREVKLINGTPLFNQLSQIIEVIMREKNSMKDEDIFHNCMLRVQAEWIGKYLYFE